MFEARQFSDSCDSLQENGRDTNHTVSLATPFPHPFQSSGQDFQHMLCLTGESLLHCYKYIGFHCFIKISIPGLHFFTVSSVPAPAHKLQLFTSTSKSLVYRPTRSRNTSDEATWWTVGCCMRLMWFYSLLRLSLDLSFP